MKKAIHILLLFSIINVNSLTAQLNIGGTPISFQDKYINLSGQDIPIISLEELDNEQLLYDAKLNESKDRPWQFGKNIDMNIDVIDESFIDQLSNGKLYRMAIYSEHALSINLRFSKYILPDKAYLYIYNDDKTDIIGGFTSENNQESKIFATGLIKGEKIIIEYFEPNDVEFQAKLNIDRVTHGFRTVGDYLKGFGHSGDCNMNVACDDGTWSDEIRSVCMLVTGSSGFCTAALINNTSEDGTPYILTADHCYKEPSSMVFMFNWESETCDDPMISPSHDDLSGAVLTARYYESDFCLFEMNDEPPYNYNVYYSGWNADDAPSTSSVCIHHPSGDIKKISYDDDASISDFYLGNQGVQDSHWKVIWDRETTTEPGSSGSPLYNQNKRIIGQLHGGYASCTNLDQADWYGKFSYSWDEGSSPETRLKDWLDPYNSGITDLPGYDPNVPVADNDAQILAIINPEAFYYGDNTIAPLIKIRNRGLNELVSLTVNYIIDNDNLQTKTWTGSLLTSEIEEIEFDPVDLSIGEHTIVFYIEDPNGTEDEYHYNDTLRKSFYIYETIFSDDFESGKSWYLTGEFQIADPRGYGGETGFADPTDANSGIYVLGTDLTGLGKYKGDYENNIGYDVDFAQSPVIDCSNFTNTALTFYRYLGVDKENFDDVSIEIDSDFGSETIWSNSANQISDTSWVKQTFDISSIADGNKFMIRFNIGPTDQSKQYCGWNIDDLIVSGTSTNSEIPIPDNIQIYPNPAREYFYIEINDSIESGASVTISDISGEIIYFKSFSLNEINTVESDILRNYFIIEPETTHTGIFIVTVKTSTNSYSRKIALM